MICPDCGGMCACEPLPDFPPRPAAPGFAQVLYDAYANEAPLVPGPVPTRRLGLDEMRRRFPACPGLTWITCQTCGLRYAGVPGAGPCPGCAHDPDKDPES